jgi:nucleoid-associated protein YgaU
MAKYKNSVRSTNNSKEYKEILERRGVKKITQFRTKIFNKIDLSNISNFSYVWKKGDNLFRLSNRFYGNKDYWWSIAMFNQKPTDAKFEIGDVIYIPTDPLYGRL